MKTDAFATDAAATASVLQKSAASAVRRNTTVALLVTLSAAVLFFTSDPAKASAAAALPADARRSSAAALLPRLSDALPPPSAAKHATATATAGAGSVPRAAAPPMRAVAASGNANVSDPAAAVADAALPLRAAAASGNASVSDPAAAVADATENRVWPFVPAKAIRAPAASICGAAPAAAVVTPAAAAALPAPLTISNVTCPAFEHASRDESDAVEDRRSEWVVKKYKEYADRCNKTRGVMWKKLDVAAHDRIADKVLRLGGLLRPARRRGVALLDWASGCGVTLDYVARKLRRRGTPFHALGVDLTGAAVAYANSTFAWDGVRYCHADGTALEWVPTDSVDMVTAFGGLLHVPTAFMCRTVANLLRIVRPGGTVWAGYIDNADTLQRLMACRVACGGGGGGAEVASIDENRWFQGVGVPRSNRRLKPHSVVWRKTK
jgi:hypothetical protein